LISISLCLPTCLREMIRGTMTLGLKNIFSVWASPELWQTHFSTCQLSTSLETLDIRDSMYNGSTKASGWRTNRYSFILARYVSNCTEVLNWLLVVPKGSLRELNLIVSGSLIAARRMPNERHKMLPPPYLNRWSLARSTPSLINLTPPW
jgi:hypothetical protein